MVRTPFSKSSMNINTNFSIFQETDQILDLFNLGETAEGLDKPSLNGTGEEREEDMVDATGEVREKGKKGWLDDLGELWDDKQYEEEFDLQGFLGKMK